MAKSIDTKKKISFKIKGIRKRVIISFMSVVLLLLFSSLVSYFELRRLGDETAMILESNKRNIELVRDMLSATQSQNITFMQMTINENKKYDQLYRDNLKTLEMAVESTRKDNPTNELLDSISQGVSSLRLLANEVVLSSLDSEEEEESQEEMIISPLGELSPRLLFFSRYKVIYDKLIENIYDFMTSTQTTIEPKAQALYHNAYRAVTPVLISLAVMVAIVLMLLYFVLLYVVDPILGINKSLREYISFKIPFKVKSECKDEVEQLRDNIEILTKRRVEE